MFKVIVTVMTLAGQALGFGVSSASYATLDECKAAIPARVEVMRAKHPADKLQGMCIDKALIERIVHKQPLPKGTYEI